MSGDKILLVVLVCLTLEQSVICQDDLIVGNEKSGIDGGAQSRTIYSQRNLNPHRMIHFGKRAEIAPLPNNLSPEVFDLYQPMRLEQQNYRPNKYPYLLTIELQRGQTLQAVPEDYTALVNKANGRDNFDMDRPLDAGYFIENRTPKLANQPRDSFDATKFLRLMKSDEPNVNGNNGDQLNLDSDMSSPLDQFRAKNQQQNDKALVSMDLDTRLAPSFEPNSIKIPRAFLLTLSNGRQNPALQTITGLTKKVEPQKNQFIHFG